MMNYLSGYTPSTQFVDVEIKPGIFTRLKGYYYHGYKYDYMIYREQPKTFLCSIVESGECNWQLRKRFNAQKFYDDIHTWAIDTYLYDVLVQDDNGNNLHDKVFIYLHNAKAYCEDNGLDYKYIRRYKRTWEYQQGTDEEREEMSANEAWDFDNGETWDEFN